MLLTTPPSSVQTSTFLEILPKIHIAMEVVAVYPRQDMNSNHAHTKLPSTAAQPSPNPSDVYQHKQMCTHTYTHTETDQPLGSQHQQINKPTRLSLYHLEVEFTLESSKIVSNKQVLNTTRNIFPRTLQVLQQLPLHSKQTGKRSFEYLSSNTILRERL